MTLAALNQAVMILRLAQVQTGLSSVQQMLERAVYHLSFEQRKLEEAQIHFLKSPETMHSPGLFQKMFFWEQDAREYKNRLQQNGRFAVLEYQHGLKPHVVSVLTRLRPR